MEHDIFYKQYKDTKQRHQADKILARKAMKRFRSKDASLGERIVALGTAGVMKAKVKLGMGLKGQTTTTKITKQTQRQCLNKLTKIKTEIENSLENIRACIQLINGDNKKVLKKQSNKKRLSSKNTQKKVVKKQNTHNNNMDIDIPDHNVDYPIRREDRKNKIDFFTERDPSSSSSRPIIKAKRRKLDNSNTTLEMDELINMSSRKRKIDEDDLTDRDDIPAKVQVINSS